jgi:hypothetical protein
LQKVRDWILKSMYRMISCLYICAVMSLDSL